MRPRLVLPVFTAAILLVGLLPGCGGGSGASQADKDKAIAQARTAYGRLLATSLTPGISGVGETAFRRRLYRGPCISEQLPGLSDWSVDIAHDPRQPVDDRPANQCQRFRDGETHHFVELTPGGQLIRAQ